jgi:hypothetical protein
MKYLIRSIFLLTAFPVLSSAQSFVNLDFEHPVLPLVPDGGFKVSITNAMPGWTGYIGTNQQSQILYNDEALDSASISILSTNYIFGIPGLVSGTFYVKIRGSTSDPTVVSALSQTGTIPATATTLLFYAYNPPTVTFQGNQLTLVSFGPKGSFATIYGADIRAFVGQTGELRFSGFSYFDDIQFSTQPIPEPGSFGILALGATFFAFSKRRKSDR